MRPYFVQLRPSADQSWTFLGRQLDDEIPFQWHFHPEYELTLTLNSRGRRYVGDHIGSYDDGDLVLLGPNLPHTWASVEKIDDSLPHRALVMWFRAEWVDKVVDGAVELGAIRPMLAGSRRGIRFSSAATSSVRDAILAMETLPTAKRFFNLLDILVTLSSNADWTPLTSPELEQRPFEPSERPRVERVLDYIHGNYQEQITIDALAELAHLSASGLHRMFKRHTRMTIFEYIAQLRIGRACQILIATDKPVAHIADSVGYNNLSHFNRQFLGLKRVAPREFRRKFTAQQAR
jgi:AraC-like DNA-binding protein